ncbi:hypothetical protein DVR12_04030 [Chitinophaga silvatica]|uniref:DUF4198 domain-containing protein n=1 Tax=Chitinophaga silvatica TaxID=2282649 RepID=A0A3E1YHT4_9BACT|nr:hypothetical protein [Chitinophaga silvatica]RFS26959.1 hypothetical protein DVR12_04030 [Chitinophaga silvatica]
MRKLLFTVLFCFSMQALFAHALWIETITTGKIGQTQEVKVYLGEYADGQRDSTQHWFSNMKDFTLYLIAPDGKKEALQCTANGNHFKATFTPTVAGTYTLSVDHTVQEVYGGSKIRYYALGLVKVNGSAEGLAQLPQRTDFTLLAQENKKFKVNQPTNVKFLYKQEKTPEAAELTVQSPAGWAKKFKADEQGAVTFQPFWSGKYMLEGTFTENISGTHEGKPFERIWHCVTYCMDVDK